MLLRFVGPAAEILAKFREIERRCTELEQQYLVQANCQCMPAAKETRCQTYDPSLDSFLHWPSATLPES